MGWVVVSRLGRDATTFRSSESSPGRRHIRARVCVSECVSECVGRGGVFPACVCESVCVLREIRTRVRARACVWACTIA